MKNIIKVTLTLIVLSFSSCTFDLFEETGLYYPEVKIITIENNAFNETEVTFSVAESKKEEVSFMGIAKSTNAKPKTHERQDLFQGDLGTFTYTIEGLSSDSTYNFIAFAGNSSGYAESDVYTFAVPDPVPITAPCAIQSNVVKEEGSDYTTSRRLSANRSSKGGAFYIEATYFAFFTQRQLEFHFPTIPKTGRYTTTTFDKFGGFNTGVLPDFYNSQGAFIGNQFIYVTVANNVITVDFCDLEFKSNVQDVKISGSISANF